MDVPTQLELCLCDQLDIRSYVVATCFLTFYCDLYSLFKVLNFYLMLVCLLFVVQSTLKPAFAENTNLNTIILL